MTSLRPSRARVLLLAIGVAVAPLVALATLLGPAVAGTLDAEDLAPDLFAIPVLALGAPPSGVSCEPAPHVVVLVGDDVLFVEVTRLAIEPVMIRRTPEAWRELAAHLAALKAEDTFAERTDLFVFPIAGDVPLQDLITTFDVARGAGFDGVGLPTTVAGMPREAYRRLGLQLATLGSGEATARRGWDSGCL